MILVLPLGIAWFAAVALALLDGCKRWVGWLAAAAMAAQFATTLWLAGAVLAGGPQELVAGGWPAGVGITLRADALGVTFAALSMGVLLAALLYEVIGGVHTATFPAVVLFMAAGLTGLFLTGDVFNLYVFFEVSMTAAFVLASMGREPHEARASLIFVVVNLLGSAMLLGAIAALYHVIGTLDMRGIAAYSATVEAQSMVLIATIIFVAFSVKIGLFPFHFWLPPVYRDTWPAATAILSGAIANIGSYGLLRFGANLLPRELSFGALVLLVLGAASILYGAHQAVSVRTANEALAYSSISQAGYILVALSLGGAVGYAAAVLYTVVNAVNKTTLFLAAGLRGWLVGATFAVGAWSVAGVPPSLGFFGKLALFQAGIAANSIVLLGVLLLGGALAFVYMFQIYQRDYWWRDAPDDAPSPLAARLLVLALAGLIVAVGVWPEPLLAVSRQAAGVLMEVGP
jgi:multicomponent Na+:H+ antiporter subunit D